MEGIKCNVGNCKHNKLSKMCELGSIEVGKTNTNPSSCKDTECESFDCI